MTQATVVNRFMIRGDTIGHNHAPGLVIVLQGADAPPAGTEMNIPLTDGRMRSILADEMKDHGNAFSVFIADLVLGDVSNGVAVQWTTSSSTSARPDHLRKTGTYA